MAHACKNILKFYFRKIYLVFDIDEEGEQDIQLLITVATLLLRLKKDLLINRIGLFVRTKLLRQVHLSEKEVFLEYFQRNISRIVNHDKDSYVAIHDIQQLKSVINSTYLVELISKRADGSSEFKKIVGKRLQNKTYDFVKHFIKLYGKHFFKIRRVPLPQERIRSELYYAQKMKEAKVRVPKIIHADLESGYIFTEFIRGTNLENMVHQIFLQKHIKKWQKQLFKEIGQGLAEINLKLKAVHGDPRTHNWIYEDEIGKLFLIDWECAGKGDPAWDLASLVYNLGKKFSHLIYDQNSKTQDETIDLFEEIYLAITTGYAQVDVDKEIVRRFAGYWLHFALLVSPKIHEKIFQHQGISLPRGFQALRWLHAPFIPTMTKEQNVAKRLIFRFWKNCITFYRFMLLILGKTDPEVVIIGDS